MKCAPHDAKRAKPVWTVILTKRSPPRGVEETVWNVAVLYLGRSSGWLVSSAFACRGAVLRRELRTHPLEFQLSL